ncbi:MAG: hypothetical protein IPK16_07115 [Anaerolineales bacterium]|nr:hypothetical protein [Anaerolineales bacterium]
MSGVIDASAPTVQGTWDIGMAVSRVIGIRPNLQGERRDNGMAVSGVIDADAYRRDNGMAVSGVIDAPAPHRPGRT